jgi:hypothetical protein
MKRIASRLMIRSLHVLLVASLFVLSACLGPTRHIAPIPPERTVDNAGAIQTRLQLKETYTFNRGFTVYMLPYGPYYPEGQDQRGIYYRAPIPIVRRGLFGGESLIRGGIYVPTDMTWSAGLVWLYLRNDDGSVDVEGIPGPFATTYGDRWYREPYTGSPPPFQDVKAAVSFSADGKPEGLFELRTPDGKVQVRGNFEQGRKTGTWIFADSGGVKVAELTYRDGLRDGPFQMWYGSFAFPESAGKDKLAATFDADQLDGDKTRWRKDGSPECKTRFDHGTIINAECWDGNGVQKSQSDSLKMARDELKADEEWFKEMDGWIDGSIRAAKSDGAERPNTASQPTPKEGAAER